MITVNTPDKSGWTPLHAACSRAQSLDCIEILITCGNCHVNTLTNSRATALHYLVR